MKKVKWIVGFFALAGMILGVHFALSSEHALVMHPKGIIARKELHLILINVALMLLILLPTTIWLLIAIWKRNSNKTLEEKESSRVGKELLFWGLPSLIVLVMALITWKATHQLDPYRPLESHVKPFEIQVVALDWKWLFIYPEQKIASLNFFQFPDQTPIKFSLTSDGSPMNAFWLPELSGQIYCMTGMVTPLHVMADGPGTYSGRAAEINGEGYSGMTFQAKSSSEADFKMWVEEVKQSPSQLNRQTYDQLFKPSLDEPVILYSDVESNLFNQIIMKYMSHDW